MVGPWLPDESRGHGHALAAHCSTRCSPEPIDPDDPEPELRALEEDRGTALLYLDSSALIKLVRDEKESGDALAIRSGRAVTSSCC